METIFEMEQSSTAVVNGIKELTNDDEPWEIESDSDADVDLDVSPHCKVLMLDVKKNILVPYRKLENSSCPVSKQLSNEDNCQEFKTEDKSNLPVAKNIKPLRFTELLEMHMTPDLIKKDSETNHKIPVKKVEHNEEVGMNLNQNIINSKTSSNLYNSTCFDENPRNFLRYKLGIEPPENICVPSWSKNCCDPSSKNLHDLSSSKDLYSPSCSKDLYSPSCSKDLYSPSCSKDLYSPSCSKDLYSPSCSKDLYSPSCSKDLYSPSCSKDLYSPSCSKDLYSSSYSKDLYSPSCSEDLYGPSCSKDLYSPSYLKDFYNPSTSKDLPGLSSSTNSSAKFDSLHAVSKLPVNISSNMRMKQEEEVELLQHFYNKSHFNEFIQKTKSEEENEINEGPALAMNECDLIKNLLKCVNKCNEDSNHSLGSSKCFEDDPDIVNPDIMFNINLNEHLKQMNLLIEKISKTPNDPSLLDECMQLKQIPQVEFSKKIFSAKERQNFAEGNPDWEYEIDKEDWNKIMVKRAVVFTAHAGFSIANEESLYVLADVIISHIKKLAVIMKKNFDIQSKSSCPDSIDPINNSLQELGVTGGISELIKHYENDVFGKRDKLMKKCQHFQKIIDQFAERLFLDPKIKNKYTKDNIGEENSFLKCMKKDETVFQKENITVTETLKTEVQTMVEELNCDTQISSEKTEFTNSEVEQQTEPIYMDYIDNESKMDIDSNNFEKTKTDFVDSIISINDRKINFNKKRIGTVTTDDSDIDLLKPLEITVARSKDETSNIESECLSFIDLEEQGSNIFTVKKACDKNVLDLFNHANKIINIHQKPASKTLLDKAESSKAREDYLKAVNKEFDDEYELYKARLKDKNYKFPETKLYKNPADNKRLDAILNQLRSADKSTPLKTKKKNKLTINKKQK